MHTIFLLGAIEAQKEIWENKQCENLMNVSWFMLTKVG
jgi:hypothetical protein